MRHIAALVVVAGCAAAERPQVGEDAADGKHDAALDAPRLFDAPQSDAPMIDAPMIDAPPMIDACVPNVTELLANPNFDLAPVGVNWTEIRYLSSEALVVVGAAGVAQSGVGFGLLGGYYADFPGDTADDYLYQEFLVPPNTTQLVVSGYVIVESEETGAVPYDDGLLGFLFPNAPATAPIIVLALDNTDAPNAASWTPFSVTIPQNLSGQRLRFQMESHNDYALRTAFAFDSLSVRATSGCP